MKNNHHIPLETLLYHLPQRGEQSKEYIYREVTEMKKRKEKKTIWKPAAATLALILIASQTTMAKDMLNRVQKVVFPSGTTIIQDEPAPQWVKNFTGTFHRPSMAENEKETRQSKEAKLFANEEELQKELAFTPLFPKSNQYKATTLGVYVDTEHPTQEKHTIFFAYYDTPYGKIYLQERLANRENAYAKGSDEELVEKEVNGIKVAMQGKSLDAQKDNVLLLFTLENGYEQYDKLEQIFKDFTD